MKKLLIILLLISFHLGYLEWGNGNHSFIYQAELDIFRSAGKSFANLAHPFIIIPFLGMLLLIFSLFRLPAGRRWVYLGMACLSVLMLLILFIGIMGARLRILLSTVPFFTIAVLLLFQMRRQKQIEKI